MIRPARNASKLVCGKFKYFIYKSMITLTQRTRHGRRVFAFLESLFRLDRPFFWPAAGLNPEARKQHLLDQHKSKKFSLENDRKHDANILDNSHNCYNLTLVSSQKHLG